jgi:hypothetical protein
MLDATQEERDHVLGYMASQAPDLTVEFAQKVYAENVLNHRHNVWDVHTNLDRWWVITNPTNLYSQAQFPNMVPALVPTSQTGALILARAKSMARSIASA